MIRGTTVPQQMAKLRNAGLTYTAIAKMFNVTLERAYIYTRAYIRDHKLALVG